VHEPDLAVILAGGEGARLSILSEKRAKPAVPSVQVPDHRLRAEQLRQLHHRQRVVLTQYNPRSLQRSHRPGAPVGPGTGTPAECVSCSPTSGGERRATGTAGRRMPCSRTQRARPGRRGHRGGPRRRSRLQDGLPAVRGVPPPQARRCHAGRPPGAARRRHPDGDPGHGRQRDGSRTSREAEAAQVRPRQHGRLRVQQARPPRWLADSRSDFGAT